ncbi:manganese efflux pump MntP [Celerinatantimonas diazotrophica]|uniref:Putative manganese efflux pump MntP n=1 Tax=Celerinatantimonas diazotrophica TaxID=412034 RepID=A0A4R1K4D7_9GAMM|nr:manganese efflux pump MntP family protein [Celerinatantimonas diazotrophica]TCK58996.1 putative Mn2+ efflux pump MntP [Celerinatantimonas diazotrophica]CAG9297631.1 putative manganese efflux pump MntP [Celerinatantimonas diazotrophica]
MNPIAFTFLALAMSTDAFAAAVGKGAAIKKPRFIDALKMGLLFGVIEAISPIIGWFAGHFAAGYINAWDHWIAFFMLAFLGINMIRNGCSTGEDAQGDDVVEKVVKPSLVALVFTAIGTSIDSAAVGVSLAFVNMNIYVAAFMIGLSTTVMVTLGVMVGRMVGQFFGNRAEIMGGMTLVTVGVWIVLEHTHMLTSI